MKICLSCLEEKLTAPIRIGLGLTGVKHDLICYALFHVMEQLDHFQLIRWPSGDVVDHPEES